MYVLISNQIKSLLLSHHHSTSALVSEILMSVLQTVQKTTDNLHMDRQCKKNNNNNLHMDRQCKKTTNNLHMDRQCKKTTNNLHMDRQCKKKQQQQFTYGQYIFTDCTEDNVQNTHTYTQYTQCTIKTHSIINYYNNCKY